MTQKKRQLSHFLNFYVFLTVELPQGVVIVVAFEDQIVEYANETLYYLTHAYCISIHKSQGNEYPIVLLPVVSEYRFMLNRRLLYTAITRAKSSLIIIGDRHLFKNALEKKEHGRRYTSLIEQLHRFFDHPFERV